MEAGQSLDVSADLVAVVQDDPLQDDPPAQTTGTLVVQVEPSGTISVEGGNCRAGQACTVPTGTRRVTCSRGGRSTSTTVRVRANQQSSLTCYTEQRVLVRVRGEDGESLTTATIVIDDETFTLQQDKPARLAAGPHRIEARRTGFEVIDPMRTVNIDPAFEEPERLIILFRIRGQ